MDPMMMLKTSAALFTIAAIGGLAMAAIRLGRRSNPPAWLAMLHGLLAASGLTLLAYAACTSVIPAFAVYGLVLLLFAAVGGLVLNLAYQWRNLPLPIWLMLVHAAFAVAGFALLLLALLRPAGA